jgi:hypothetical protein
MYRLITTALIGIFGMIIALAIAMPILGFILLAIIP